ncbi:UDP-N-acetylglucosamine--N-acetylmuramyl-(pentapeptide) pyrophosphoryl-undecaprenol N-acetylglucosamine transferase [hydrothermal vent metagenome]|uniref:UDP-N-acetylglucosamine--N-acetylmuramyl-(Pentapeptide) pyrophosphoryl-undecaprenol N-acetylglucosamine transferase n=1 Tax=hydrothermal vent metagenome TaxID=652676 RepID=A0A3B1E5K3_9ZZZZ
MNNVVVVTGGGTGGHLSIARSLITELHYRDTDVIFIGSQKGADKQWFEHEDKISRKYFLDTKGVVNQNLFGKIVSLLMIIKAMLRCLFIYKKYNVKKVISVGGFSAAPASFATLFFKCDFYIHEQNSVMGKLNKITSKNAKAVFSSYDKNSLVLDYPINNIFFKKARLREHVNTIIFLGGSQGALAINNLAIEIAPYLKKKNIHIIHQTGKLDFNRVKNKYKRLNIDVDVFDFTYDILEKMNKADFAVSRAGASTLWELSALGMPTLYIPYPYAASNHQYFNAKFLLDNDLCFLKTQNEISIDYLKKIIKLNMKHKSQQLISSIGPNGINKIIDFVLK